MVGRIVVAADLGIMRKGIASVLARHPQLQVVAETDDGAEAVAVCHRLQPDLLILALWSSPFADLAVTRLLAADRHAPRILVIAQQSDAAAVQAAREAGAAGFLPATAGDDELCAVVTRVLAGEVVTPELDDPAAAPQPLLGAQEHVILELVAQGLPNKAIARRQGISERTVGNHLQHIFRKLGVSNRMEAVCRARQLGILRHG
jgi:DNA-binding NarL/FixJ family response regulator